ncbi:MAG TPA: hypothetical protein VMY34_07645 [Acidimicrobiales bacterium]|nr:hypothetical protein [Acidimicrobiales bacterium]
MVLLVVAAVWFTCSIPIALVLARAIGTPRAELLGMDDHDALYRFADGRVERFAMLRPVTKP